MRGALLVLTLLAAACASGDPSPRAGGAGGEPSELAVFASCGEVMFPDLPPDTSTFEPFASWDDLDLSNLDGEAPFFQEFVDRYSWFVADQSSSTRLLFGEPNEPTEGASMNGEPLLGDSLYAYAYLELTDGRWAPRGWGDCRIELEADGWGNARFILDPTVRPDPQSSTLSVLATEMGCAGGQAPRGRDVRAVVLDETDEAVSVVILVEPPTGGQTCPAIRASSSRSTSGLRWGTGRFSMRVSTRP
jgi:hypothetical protein